MQTGGLESTGVQTHLACVCGGYPCIKRLDLRCLEFARWRQGDGDPNRLVCGQADDEIVNVSLLCLGRRRVGRNYLKARALGR
jgi:hypothetical protein